MYKFLVVLFLQHFLFALPVRSEQESYESCLKKFLNVYQGERELFRFSVSKECSTCLEITGIHSPQKTKKSECFKETIRFKERVYFDGKRIFDGKIKQTCFGSMLTTSTRFFLDHSRNSADPVDQGYAFLKEIATKEIYVLTKDKLQFTETQDRFYDIKAYSRLHPGFEKLKLPKGAEYVSDGHLRFKGDGVDVYKIVNSQMSSKQLLDKFKKKHCPKMNELTFDPIPSMDLQMANAPGPSFNFLPICRAKKNLFEEMRKEFTAMAMEQCPQSLDRDTSVVCSLKEHDQWPILLAHLDYLQAYKCP